MEPILTLDLADSPARLRVVSYEEENLKVWSELTVNLTELPDDIIGSASIHESASGSENSAEVTATVGEVNEKNSFDSASEESFTKDSTDIAPTRPDPSAYFVSQLTAAIEKLEPVWTSSALLVAPDSYHSLNLELPFNDDKNVIKVLSLEAQDRLPFNIDEFFIEHKVLGARPDNQYDVHVTLTRKDEIGLLLNYCQQAGLDPMAISTVPSLLEARVALDPDRFSPTSAYLSLHGSNVFLAFRVDGQFKSDRVFRSTGLSIVDIVSEVRRSIGSAEARYSTPFDELWFDNESSLQRPADTEGLDIEALENALAKNLKAPIKLFSAGGKSSASLTDGFAIFCQDGKSSKLMVNLRSGQFSQTLRWGALWKLTSSVLPYFLVLAFASVAILIAIYFIREKEIENLQANVISKVQPLLGDAKLAPGQLVKTIQAANDTIEKQLKDLGSPSKFSSLDVLSEVTKDFSSVKDVSITAVTIRGTQLTVTGTSATYENVDALEKVLQSKRTLYCRPSKQVSGTGVRQFTFTIALCD